MTRAIGQLAALVLAGGLVYLAVVVAAGASRWARLQRSRRRR
jgi:hypothetical protein